MMSDIRIRDAAAEDAAAIVLLNDSAVQHTSAMDEVRLKDLQALADCN
jgi:predicted GNAT superfamily acetyltransferase